MTYSGSTAATKVRESIYKVELAYQPAEVFYAGNFRSILNEGLIRKVQAVHRWIRDTGNERHYINWYTRGPGELIVVMRDRNAALMLKLTII